MKVKIDAHQHFWKYSRQEYGWIVPDMNVLQRNYLPHDLWPHLKQLGFDGTVAVQARQVVEETRWLLELAEQHPFIKGVVGWVDLCSPQLREQLERFSDQPRLCGVRHVIHDEPDRAFALRDDFVRGMGMLPEYGLTYDLLLFPEHLPVACELVGRFPDQPFVLDHIAKPAVKDRILEPWGADLEELAGFPNVCCKVSGMVTEADWQNWAVADFTPYLDRVFEAFGPGRIMIGSDWPVCTVAGEYEAVMHIVSDYVQKLSRDEQAAVLGGTATRFYGLE